MNINNLFKNATGAKKPTPTPYQKGTDKVKRLAAAKAKFEAEQAAKKAAAAKIKQELELLFDKKKVKYNINILNATIATYNGISNYKGKDQITAQFYDNILYITLNIMEDIQIKTNPFIKCNLYFSDNKKSIFHDLEFKEKITNGLLKKGVYVVKRDLGQNIPIQGSTLNGEIFINNVTINVENIELIFQDFR